MNDNSKCTLFNSTFELELRIISLLATNHYSAYSMDRILALDFISCYAGKFGFPYRNLHGNGQYVFGEIANRRIVIQEAIKNLVVSGLITPVVDRGYFYIITDIGEKYIDAFESNYALEYIEIARIVNQSYAKISDSELMEIIEDKSLSDLKGAN